jgi:hypothetical protein
MDRDEHVCLVVARLDDSAAQADESIGVPHHHGAHTILAIDRRCEPPRDRERHLFFMCAASADGARVLATVTGIHRNHEVATLLPGGYRL